jgi:thiamine-monophosphate kinase
LTNRPTTIGDVGERELLRRLQARIPESPRVAVGVGDDTALVEIRSPALVTADSLVEGVHFHRHSAPARLLGRKALAVNLSDAAAMGGVGCHAIVSLCLPRDLEVAWVDSLYDGLLERAAESGVDIVGGNVTGSPDAVVVDVTLIGETRGTLLRSGAEAGDLVVVTGELGAAAEGLRLLEEGARLDEDGRLRKAPEWAGPLEEAVASCLRAHLDPRPPLVLAGSLAERGLAGAGMDVSDGLSSDLAEMCARSGVAARLDAGVVPVARATHELEQTRGGDGLSLALHGGEDYELLLAVAPGDFDALEELARVWGVSVHAIGEFLPGPPQVRLADEDGERELVPGGHDHFVDLGAITGPIE